LNNFRESPKLAFHDELLIVVDKDDQIIDYKNRLECHKGNGLLHRAFSIFIFKEGKVLVPKRSRHKQLWPLYWSNSCCSHPRKGEDLHAAVQRRLVEELGVSARLKYLYTFQYQASYRDIGIEKEVCSVYIGTSRDEIAANPWEVAEWKYIAINDLTIDMERHPEKYTPWFKLEWLKLVGEHLHEIKRL
jgi:isopentenyl-diphosphate delta-isomerase